LAETVCTYETASFLVALFLGGFALNYSCLFSLV
jgi:hypothetical protein